MSENGKGQTVFQMGSGAPVVPEEILKTGYQAIKRILSAIFSFIGSVVIWIGTQLPVEAYKYYCSIYGLMVYTFDLCPVKIFFIYFSIMLIFIVSIFVIYRSLSKSKQLLFESKVAFLLILLHIRAVEFKFYV